MKKSRYAEEKASFAAEHAETASPWRSWSGGWAVRSRPSPVEEGLRGALENVKHLEDESRELNKLLADLSLDKHILQNALSKKL